MSGKRRARVSSAEARQREMEAWELRTSRHFSRAQIALQLGVSEAAVSKMLQRCESRVLERIQGNVLSMKVEQTAALEKIAGELTAEWERSKEDGMESVVWQQGNSEGRRTRRIGRIGNPALALAAIRARAELRDIWIPKGTPAAAPLSPQGREAFREKLERLAASMEREAAEERKAE